MLRVGHYLFKRADTSQEFEEIHRLNHRTFVDEIPQHEGTDDGLLIDKFHSKNSYFIVLRADRLVGMLSTHDQPPFSVAERLREPQILDRPGTRPLEVRLLAIEPKERNSTLFAGLVWCLYEFARAEGYTHLYISGVEERVDLYTRLGFVALGPAIPCGSAAFVPMVLTVGQIPLRMERFKKLWETHLGNVSEEKRSGGEKERRRKGDQNRFSSSPLALFSSSHGEPMPATEDRGEGRMVCLLPGPVTLSVEVQAAFRAAPIYHRGSEFIGRFVMVRELLGRLVGGRDVAILNGSGTLANEAVAATLAAEAQGRLSLGFPSEGGIMLVNGEFGERLARQATRFGLRPRVLSWSWGKPWNLGEVEAVLAQEPADTWIWGVHQESSTGVLNDLPGLVRLAKKNGARVCVDCISSLGAVPLDLSEVHLATGSTGKALGSYAGAAIVFADRGALQGLDRSGVPSYLDIAAALASDGPCYTFPSPTLAALEAALAEYATPAKAEAVYHRYHEIGLRVRRHLRDLGFRPLADEECASPVVTTFAPPEVESSEKFVKRCRSLGFTIGGESAYLSQRRLVQIATMGAVSWDMVAPLFEQLARCQESEGQSLQPAR